ncbi:unnamed protein product [Caenorhabditis bovis]|uniref:Centrosomal protein CEP104 Zn finger domain-containing protein n=1 Tax=Caenorhabditis bovis TaxID=2654633 RepID=A0A8S1EQB7_9PELO|nr:unnamed protein product [Caenorhabditis bovis]
MKAFGVNSKWTPDKNPTPDDDWRPITPLKQRKRATTPKRDQRAESRQSRRFEPESEEKPKSRPRSSASAEPKPTKKNQRLAEVAKYGLLPDVVQSANGTVTDDPYKLPTHIGQCPHCQVTENGLGQKGAMEKHFAKLCKVMTTCKYCLKVVMVAHLTDHLIYRCDFLKGTMDECGDCGLAIDKEDKANDSGHPMCRGRKPPSGAQWCPLCTVAVNDDEQDWREHLTTTCYNNPRIDGPERDPYEIKSEQDKILNAAKARKEEEKRKAEEKKKLEEQKQRQQQQQQQAASMTPYPGKMIDADKLVAALQEIQERKKAEKKKKFKELENS